jgi:hypothetical protein
VLLDRGRDDAVGEDRGGRAHGRDLELLLGAEVREEAALAHVELGGQAPDREALEALDRSDVHRGAEDRAPCLVALDLAAVGNNGRGGSVCDERVRNHTK